MISIPCHIHRGFTSLIVLKFDLQFNLHVHIIGLNILSMPYGSDHRIALVKTFVRLAKWVQMIHMI